MEDLNSQNLLEALKDENPFTRKQVIKLLEKRVINQF